MGDFLHLIQKLTLIEVKIIQLIICLIKRSVHSNNISKLFLYITLQNRHLEKQELPKCLSDRFSLQYKYNASFFITGGVSPNSTITRDGKIISIS